MFHAQGVKQVSNSSYNNYELATDEFSYNYKRYKKSMPWDAFKKFGYVKGQILCEKYNIILTGHKTNAEKAHEILDKFNFENFNKGLTKFNKGMKQFNQMIGEQPKPAKERKSKRRKIKDDDPMDFGLGPAPKLNIWGKEAKPNLWGKQEKFKL